MALRAGCVLGVFDALDHARAMDDVAERTGADQDVLARYLRVLLDLGLVVAGPDGYSLTEMGATFRSDHPSRLCDLVLMRTEPNTVAAWTDLDHALRSGDGVYERVNGVSHWQHLAAHPDLERVFNAAMARRGLAEAQTLLESVDLDGVSLLVDVGGGRGAMVGELLAARPDLKAVVADRAAVAEEATSFLAARGFADRARGVPCDFFSSVPPGGDVYTMAHVLHDWTDDECIRILRTVREAMLPEARLMVLERLLDMPGRDPMQQRELHLLDLHMLVLFGARERTRAEYDALFVAAGFESPRVSGAADWNVLEAVPA